MQELGLAIGLVAATLWGLESVATVAGNWTTERAQADDLEDMLDLNFEHPQLDFDVGFADGADGEAADAPAAPGESQ